MILLHPHERLVRLPEVKQKSGKSRSAIYKGMQDGTFPKSISLGSKSVAWLESEIDAWISDRVQASRGNNQAGGNSDVK